MIVICLDGLYFFIFLAVFIFIAIQIGRIANE